MSIRILLVDDHRILRQGLRFLLEMQPDMHVVGEAADGRMAMQLCADVTPDVVIMDVTMPELNGIDATRKIMQQAPSTRVIALSMHANRAYIEEMLQAGASGYLLKESAYEDLVRAIRVVLDGQRFLSEAVTAVMVRSSPSVSGTRKGARLTEREREVWQLLAEGHTNNAIADRLTISVRTVETHRKNLMEKLDARSVADLTRLAIREGLIALHQ